MALFLKSIGAGVLIGISALAFLLVANPIVGAILFSFGLITIIIQGYYLYTGRIGGIDSTSKIPSFLIMLAGNAIGAIGIGLLLSATGTVAISAAAPIVAAKLSKGIITNLIMSGLCGVMMQCAVSNYAKTKNPLIVTLCIMVFILGGFEHCIANMFYFGLTHTFSLTALRFIIINILGNSIGAILFNRLEKLEKF